MFPQQMSGWLESPQGERIPKYTFGNDRFQDKGTVHRRLRCLQDMHREAEAPTVEDADVAVLAGEASSLVRVPDRGVPDSRCRTESLAESTQ